MKDKTFYRKKYQQLRAQLSLEEVEGLSLMIANNALSLPIWTANYFHIFLSIPKHKEVQTEFLLHILQGRDKSIVVPKAHFNTGNMSAILLQEHTKIELSAFGIPEPVEGLEVSPEQLDVVFVPLLAFDVSGNRLGYGKGFYDRFLSTCNASCKKIGLSFFEPEKELPKEPWDLPLDMVITPDKIYKM